MPTRFVAAQGQPSAERDFDVLRVYVPQEDHDRILKLQAEEHVVVPLSRLEEQLRERKRNVVADRISEPRLQQAIYVASLRNEFIVSDASLWQFQGRGVFLTGDLGIPVSRAAEFDELEYQLVDQLRVSPTGQLGASSRVEVDCNSRDMQCWFGFSVAPTPVDSESSKDSEKRTYHFRVPIATTGYLLIETPTTTQLTSNDVVVEKIEARDIRLPSAWPVPVMPTLADVVWWKLPLSGVSDFTVEVETLVENFDESLQHLIQSSSHEYSIAEMETKISAQFQFAQFQFAEFEYSGDLELQVDSSIRLDAVRFGDQPLQWQEVRRTGTTVFVEISPQSMNTAIRNLRQALGGSGDSAADGSRDQASSVAGPSPALGPDLSTLTVEAVSSLQVSDRSASFQLPKLGISRAYTLAGTLSVKAEGGLAVSDLDIDSSRLLFESKSIGGERANSAVGTNSDARELRWEGTWAGVMPSVNVLVGDIPTKRTVRSLTQFRVNSDWLSARTNLRLHAEILDSNEVQLQVGDAWFLDQFSLVGEPDEDFALETRTFNKSDGSKQKVVLLTWSEKREKVDVEIEVVGHRRLTGGGAVRRLIAVANSDQVDNYLVNTSNAYQVELTSNLIRFQLNFNELPQWQQDLVAQQDLQDTGESPKKRTRWIFQGVRNTVPPIRLTSNLQKFDADAYTRIARSGATDAIEYLVRIEPTGAVVSTFRIDVPSIDLAGNEPLIDWQLLKNGQPEPIPNRVENEDVSLRRYVFELDEPTSIPVIVRGTVRSSALEHIALPSIPQSDDFTSTIVADVDTLVRCNLSQSELGQHQLGPLNEFCDDPELVGLLSTFGRSDIVALRLDAKLSAKHDPLLVLLNDEGKRQSVLKGWIRSETIEHWLDHRESDRHLVTWTLDSWAADEFSFVMPIHWQIRKCTVDGFVARYDVSNADGDALSREEQLGKGAAVDGRVVTVYGLGTQSSVTMEFTSASQHAFWSRMAPIESPTALATLRASTTRVFVPPHLSLWSAPGAVEAPKETEESSAWLDRLKPAMWWSWLSLGAGESPYASSGYPGWSVIELKGLEANSASRPLTSIRIVERTAVAGVLFAFGFWIAGISAWFYQRNSVAVWSTLFGTLVAVLFVPVGWLPLMQVSTLAIGLGICAALVLNLLRLRFQRVTHGDSSVQVGSSTHLRALARLTGLLLFPICACGPTTGYSQDTRQGSAEKLHKVLIPIDEGEPAGVAYVPKSLEQSLSKNASDARLQEPRILSAEYTLRLKAPDPMLLRSDGNAVNREDGGERTDDGSVLPDSRVDQLVPELSIQFRVQAARGQQLRIPISDELILMRAQIDGKSDTTGEVSQNASDPGAVVFIPRTGGESLVRIYFRPMVTLNGKDEARIRAGIPPIPSARLRLMPDPNVIVSIKSLGQQFATSTQTVVALGPLNELDCRWSAKTAPSEVGNFTVRNSAVWVHASGDTLTAASAMEIDGLSQGEVLSVFLDDSWESVGKEWGDFTVINSQRSPLSTRRSYQVRANVGGNAKTARMRVVLTPRDQRLALRMRALPFFQIRTSIGDEPREFYWSASENAAWTTDLPRATPLNSATGVSELFEALSLSDSVQGYRMPQGAATGGVVAVPQEPNIEVTELNRLVFTGSEIRTQYEAEFISNRMTRDRLRLKIPLRSRVESVQIDGTPCRYQLVRHGSEDYLHVMVPDSVTSIRKLIVHTVKPSRVRADIRLERPLLEEVVARQSNVQLIVEAGLQCEVMEQDSAIERERIVDEVRESQGRLQTSIGQYQFNGQYRGTSTLPLVCNVTRTSASQDVECQPVLFVSPASTGWTATLRIRLLAEELPHLFYWCLPSDLSAVIQSDHTVSMLPSGDPQTVCMAVEVPGRPDGVADLEFEFPIASNPESELRLPDLRMLTGQTPYPVIALPETIDGKPIDWLGHLVSVEGDWSDPWSGSESHLYFASEGPLSKVRWFERKTVTPSWTIQCEKWTLESVRDTDVLATAEYWLESDGQIALQLRLPDAVEVVGARLGSDPIQPFVTDDGRTVRLLLNSTMPSVRLKLLVKWSAAAETDSLRLPMLQIGQGSATALQRVVLASEVWRVRGSEGFSKDQVVESWSQAISSGANLLEDKSTTSRRDWLEMWAPSQVGLDTEWELPQDAETEVTESRTVGDVWSRVCRQLGQDASTFLKDDLVSSDMDSLRSVKEGPIVLERLPERTQARPQLLGLSLTVVSIVAVFLLGLRLRSRFENILGDYPWMWWAQLAILLWILLPVAWPSFVVGCCAMLLGLGSFRDRRRAVSYR